MTEEDRPKNPALSVQFLSALSMQSAGLARFSSSLLCCYSYGYMKESSIFAAVSQQVWQDLA